MKYHLQIPEIKEKTKQIRKNIINMNACCKGGHTGSDLSETDILASLFFRILEIPDTDEPQYGENSFILSKGHGAGGFYSTLEAMWILPTDELKTYLAFNSRLAGHPVKSKLPLINLNTGALGHGLSAGVGMALGKKMNGSRGRMYILCGDGELQEGSVWEASMSAAHFELDNLVLIIDRNKLQLADTTANIMDHEPLDRKFEAFGYDVTEIDGNDVEAIVECLEALDHSNGKPKAVIAKTVKGKGVSFIENVPAWHHKYPVGDEIETALKEIEG